jgi:hypothetical protein
MAGRPHRWILPLAGAAAAVVIFSFALSSHLRSACMERDTPYLPLCADPPTDQEAIRTELRDRLARNPGASYDWVKLLMNSPSPDAGAVLPGAVLAAPHNAIVAREQAAQALQEGRTEQGIAMLVEILRNGPSPEAANVLAQVAAVPAGIALLRPHLGTAARWLPQVLRASQALKQPPGDMLSLVAAAQDSLPDETRQNYMRMLKASGQWLDAYGLWVSYHKESVPLLYNGGFDQPIEADGFDWEFTNVPRSRAGMMVGQEAVARRGLVLDIEFTGRSFAAPIVRQYLFLPPGGYHLQGEYVAPKLRAEEGLSWSVQCMAGRKQVLGRSAALHETGGVWKQLEFDFTVPPDCGAVASLQLDPTAAYEATTGFRGHVAFDAFSLTRSAFSQ